MVKKRWVLLVLVFALALPVWAQTTRVADGAGLLNSQEITKLEQHLEMISERIHMDIVVATVNSLHGEDPDRYTENFYDSWGLSYDGVILLVSMADREWVITASGSAQKYLNRAARNHIGEEIAPYLSSGNYYGAFSAFANLCEDMIASGQSGEVYREPFSPGEALLVAGVVSVIAAFITVAVMTGKLRTVRSKHTAEDYVLQNSLNLTCARERFLYRNVTRTPKPEHNSSSRSGGGGVSHSSSHGKF